MNTLYINFPRKKNTTVVITKRDDQVDVFEKKTVLFCFIEGEDGRMLLDLLQTQLGKHKEIERKIYPDRYVDILWIDDR